jgi:NLI interacting factor-like phosphatase
MQQQYNNNNHKSQNDHQLLHVRKKRMKIRQHQLHHSQLPQPKTQRATGGRVILMDMDGTMIGHISPSVCEYDVLRAFDPKKLATFKRELTERLRYGPLRPHLQRFLRTGAAAGTRFFVYTASEDKWAGVIIPCIEKALGFKFERPLLARSKCIFDSASNDYRKSISHVMPVVARRLNSAAGNSAASASTTFSPQSPGDVGPTGQTAPSAPSTSSTVLVDNKPDVLLRPREEGAQLIKCPTYGYTYVYDVLSNVAVDILHAKFHKIADLLRKHGMFPASADARNLTFQQFMQVYYRHLADLMQSTYKENQASLKHDTFFINPERIIFRGGGGGGSSSGSTAYGTASGSA